MALQKMEIIYLGLSSFKIKGKSASVVTDPYDEHKAGLKFPKLEADAVSVSHEHDNHSNISVLQNSPVVIAGPGEYEVKGIKVLGIPTFHDSSLGAERGKNVIYKFDVDGVSVLHCGDLGHKLSEKEVEIIDKVDILLLPVGGTYTINSEVAIEVISQLEPKVVIPMHYKKQGLNEEIYGKLTGVETFLKEMGKEGIAPIPKYSTTKDKLPLELTVVVLE
jgi:L-ascorbate metabolism protein UlaG (beta-lactamase superfamily)